MIPSVLALAIVSIGLLLVAIALRSRSVATLNLMICLVAWIVIWLMVSPISMFVMHPMPGDEMRLNWIAAMIGDFLFAASILNLIYCLIISRPKGPPQRGGKHRRRRKRGRTIAEVIKMGDGSEAGDGSEGSGEASQTGAEDE